MTSNGCKADGTVPATLMRGVRNVTTETLCCALRLATSCWKASRIRPRVLCAASCTASPQQARHLLTARPNTHQIPLKLKHASNPLKAYKRNTELVCWLATSGGKGICHSWKQVRQHEVTNLLSASQHRPCTSLCTLSSKALHKGVRASLIS